jgi:hypothetical protein
MDQGTLGVANKLLIKAQSTDFDAEAAALTERAYRLLADVLNAYDDTALSGGVARKRERRHLRDRRSKSGASGPNEPCGATNPTGAHGRHVDWIDLPRRGQVDLWA